MTGLAQISGRSDLNFEDEVKLDTYYIENWTIGLDLQIIFKTPLAVLRRRRTDMKLALVHDHLIQDGGAERVLQVFGEMYPQAPIYTLLL